MPSFLQAGKPAAANKPPGYAVLEDKLQKAFREKPEHFEPLLHGVDGSPELVRRMGETKRFLELWTADPAFRAEVKADARAAGRRIGLEIDGEEIRYLYDAEFNRACFSTPGWKAPLIVQQYRVWCSEKTLHREKIRWEEAVPADARQAAWRQRQIERSLGQLGIGQYHSIIHSPVAIELSDGCSVGCWFCGVSSSKRKEDFRYTPENRELWRGVLASLREWLGPAASTGFCYWATDPLDNPDYEKFCLDFAELCGRFPQTTTAQAQKQIERVRQLLDLSRKNGTAINRLSILSLPILHKIFEAFTPGELLFTELITQNIEATSMQSNSGRARNSERLAEKAGSMEGKLPETWSETPGTIACVSGFLINMVSRTVKLVTPAPCCERWPNGYWLYEEGTFKNGEEFRALINGMADRHMVEMPQMARIARFRRDLQVSFLPDSFTLKAWGQASTFPLHTGIERIARSLADGNRTVQEISFEAEDLDGLPAGEALVFLCHLFDLGLLDEEPAA